MSEEFIYKELCSLNVSKSTRLDDIPAKFLKIRASILKKPITSIINQSTMNCKVPSSIKKARVKPLYKRSQLEVGNYRPVSILNIISKILERAVHNQLNSF